MLEEKISELTAAIAENTAATNKLISLMGKTAIKEEPGSSAGTDDKKAPKAATAEQKAEAKELGIKGYSKMNFEQLEEAISAAQKEAAAARKAAKAKEEEEEEEGGDPLSDLLGDMDEEEEGQTYTEQDVRDAARALVASAGNDDELKKKLTATVQAIVKAAGAKSGKLSEVDESKYGQVVAKIKSHME